MLKDDKVANKTIIMAKYLANAKDNITKGHSIQPNTTIITATLLIIKCQTRKWRARGEKNNAKKRLIRQQAPLPPTPFHDILEKKRRIDDFKTMALTQATSYVLKNGVPEKTIDPGSFMIGEVQLTLVRFQFTDRSIAKPKDKIEDVLLKAKEDKPIRIRAQAFTQTFEVCIFGGESHSTYHHLSLLGCHRREGIIEYVKMPYEGNRLDPDEHPRHKIRLEEGQEGTIQFHRQLNHTMKECVPKKGKMIVVKNEKNELIPMRTIKGWRICMDYRKLNAVTKDYFPLTIIDQMLDRVARKGFYWYICISPNTFQLVQCAKDISKRENCAWAQDLPCEIRRRPIKIDVESKLPSASDVKPLRRFLKHGGFYKRFIRGFFQITKPLSKLLCTNQPYNFDEKCNQTYQTLKDALTSAPILITPDWSQQFELMCDVSDVTVGAMLDQNKNKVIYLIYNMSKTLNETHGNYTTT
ncbi:Retrovirus-related Pol polyprotein from transposon 17.6 [Cucumis melo var. makuwa]|uniref:Retrovirus-related Pol polyprotein from transposon 17.6 n=1 Tax=Cucumis melo var. makuwa TaxID=1194695 RepID=A0A5D3BSM7_CUCMM|nr:Retrovirus-related Pol polyprotein from transposon 17.6 [Cucumis melo var. makuwa]